jgi:hypothetical protein
VHLSQVGLVDLDSGQFRGQCTAMSILFFVMLAPRNSA